MEAGSEKLLLLFLLSLLLLLLFQVHAQPGRGEEEGEKLC